MSPRGHEQGSVNKEAGAAELQRGGETDRQTKKRWVKRKEAVRRRAEIEGQIQSCICREEKRERERQTEEEGERRERRGEERILKITKCNKKVDMKERGKWRQNQIKTKDEAGEGRGEEKLKENLDLERGRDRETDRELQGDVGREAGSSPGEQISGGDPDL